MIFEMQKLSPSFFDEQLYQNWLRKLQKRQNEFASDLSQKEAAKLLEWIGIQINKKMEMMK